MNLEVNKLSQNSFILKSSKIWNINKAKFLNKFLLPGYMKVKIFVCAVTLCFHFWQIGHEAAMIKGQMED